MVPPPNTHAAGKVKADALPRMPHGATRERVFRWKCRSLHDLAVFAFTPRTIVAAKRAGRER